MNHSAPLLTGSVLVSPPGDRVTVTSTGENAWRIELKAGYSPRARIFGAWVAAAALGVMLYSSLKAIQPLPTNPDAFPDIRNELAWSLAGLTASVIFFTALMRGRVLGTETQLLRIDPQHFRIVEGNVSAQIPWGDVRSVRLLYRPRPRKMLHPSAGKAWIMNTACGLAIETPHGTLRVLVRWHEDVARWVATLIAERTSVPLYDSSTAPAPSARLLGLTASNTRTNWIACGILAAVLGLGLAVTSWPDYRDAKDAGSWIQGTGLVKSVEVSRGGHETDITYRYVVDSKHFTNDRYDFGFGRSARYQAWIRRSALEDARETVWYNPAHPHRAVLRRRGQWIAYSLFWLGVGGVSAGLCCLFRGFTAPTQPLRKHYAKYGPL